MDSSPPPIQNQGSTCPNCGAFRPAGQMYCANCGYGMSVQPAANSGLQVLWTVLFVIIGLPAGCLGGCFLLVGVNAPTNSDDWGFWLLTLGAFALFVGLLTLMIRSYKRR
jgi:hypothetical protein